MKSATFPGDPNCLAHTIGGDCATAAAPHPAATTRAATRFAPLDPRMVHLRFSSLACERDTRGRSPRLLGHPGLSL